MLLRLFCCTPLSISQEDYSERANKDGDDDSVYILPPPPSTGDNKQLCKLRIPDLPYHRTDDDGRVVAMQHIKRRGQGTEAEAEEGFAGE